MGLRHPSPLNPYEGEYVLAFGHRRVWFHWEDASGNLSSVIQPAPCMTATEARGVGLDAQEYRLLVRGDPSIDTIDANIGLPAFYRNIRISLHRQEDQYAAKGEDLRRHARR